MSGSNTEVPTSPSYENDEAVDLIDEEIERQQTEEAIAEVAAQKKREEMSHLRQQLEESRGQKTVTLEIDEHDVRFTPISGKESRDLLKLIDEWSDTDETEARAEFIDRACGEFWQTLADHSVDETLTAEFWADTFTLGEAIGYIRDLITEGVGPGN